MSNKGNKYKVGVLVFVSFLALIISLLSLGITKYFRKTYEFMTVVNSSVTGLERGAKVKFKGVNVGQVKSVLLDSESESNSIFIIMEFDPKAFAQNSRPRTYDKYKHVDEGELLFRENLEENVKKGLRCQLQYLGITGSQYIEISYFDPVKYPVKKTALFPDAPPYLPSVETASVTNILSELKEAATSIAKVDFETISNQINEFLASANKLIQDKDTEQTMKDLREISANLKTLTSRINRALDEKKIAEIAEKFNQTVNNINRMVNSTTSLMEYLEKNPESLIRGKPERPVVDHE